MRGKKTILGAQIVLKCTFLSSASVVLGALGANSLNLAAVAKLKVKEKHFAPFTRTRASPATVAHVRDPIFPPGDGPEEEGAAQGGWLGWCIVPTSGWGLSLQALG